MAAKHPMNICRLHCQLPQKVSGEAKRHPLPPAEGFPHPSYSGDRGILRVEKQNLDLHDPHFVSPA